LYWLWADGRGCVNPPKRSPLVVFNKSKYLANNNAEFMYIQWTYAVQKFVEFCPEISDLWGWLIRLARRKGRVSYLTYFSTNSGCNSVLACPGSLQNAKSLFGGSLVVSSGCEMSLGRNYLSYAIVEVYRFCNLELVPISTTTCPNLPRLVSLDY